MWLNQSLSSKRVQLAVKVLSMVDTSLSMALGRYITLQQNAINNCFTNVFVIRMREIGALVIIGWNIVAVLIQIQNQKLELASYFYFFV
jgi:hypothetical protein